MKKFISGLLVGVLLVGVTSFSFAEDKSKTVVSQIYQNTLGDVFKVFDKQDRLQAKLGTSSGTTDNIGGSLILYKNDESMPRVAAGIGKETGSGAETLYDKNGKIRLLISGEQKDGSSGLLLYDENGKCTTMIRDNYGYIGNQQIVTADQLKYEIGQLQKEIDELKAKK